MKRRTLPAAVAAAAAASLALTACGGGGSSKSNAKITGADTGKSTPSSSPSSSADTVQRPNVTLPSDVKEVFEGWHSSDPDEAAALEDAKRRIDATDAAIANNDLNSKAIPFYYTSKALLDAADWIKGYTDDGYTITGTTRYYDPQFTKYGKGSIGLAYCSDESKAYDKNRKTNKVDKTPVTNKSYVFYNTRMDKNAQGVWQASMLASVRGSAKCTP
ncbi:hypothetical protein BFF78_18185 [Streptomyces fodineus]|uniref:Lipoprotein n=1 Tax=Streptomyces fodineus TaxID=1904616 RepID=A0A1D7YAT6_9ACTN|nr:hypothetical protein [Streptomyces fodineus]AOR32735.1 hypothetical protein BFF78_18185 [Streptomyces fodineus]